MKSFHDFGSIHFEYPSEVYHGFFYAEFSVEGDFLRHVTDPPSGNSGSFGAWLATEYPDLAGVQFSSTNDAWEQGGFTATAGTKKPVTNSEEKISEKMCCNHRYREKKTTIEPWNWIRDFRSGAIIISRGYCLYRYFSRNQETI